jgi:hypothetical protein
MLPHDFNITSREFAYVVRLLRQMDERYRYYAFYAAKFWDDTRIAEAERNGDVPGNNDVLPSGLHLRIVQ